MDKNAIRRGTSFVPGLRMNTSNCLLGISFAYDSMRWLCSPFVALESRINADSSIIDELVPFSENLPVRRGSEMRSHRPHWPSKPSVGVPALPLCYVPFSWRIRYKYKEPMQPYRLFRRDNAHKCIVGHRTHTKLYDIEHETWCFIQSRVSGSQICAHSFYPYSEL